MSSIDDLSTALKYLATFGAGTVTGKYLVPRLEKKLDEREERKIQKYASRTAETIRNEFGYLEKIESRLTEIEKKMK